MNQALLANPGIWMITLDMAFVRGEKGQKSRRLHFAIKNDKEVLKIFL